MDLITLISTNTNTNIDIDIIDIWIDRPTTALLTGQRAVAGLSPVKLLERLRTRKVADRQAQL